MIPQFFPICQDAMIMPIELFYSMTQPFFD